MSELKNKKLDKISIKKSAVKTPSRKKTIGAITLLAFGILLMPSGFLLADVIQGEIDKGIAEEVSVPSKHSSAFDDWVTNDYEGAPEMYETFYLWNLTNPSEYIGGDKPVFKEIGPFVFRRLDYKYDIDFSDDNDEVSYKEYSKYIQIYGKNISEVKITNVNPGFLGAIGTAGGTTLEFVKYAFPMILTEVKETFEIEYLKNLFWTIIQLQNTPFYPGQPKPTKWEFLIQCNYVIPGLNSMPRFPEPFPWPPEEQVNQCLPIEAVFYEKWANDYFPNTGARNLLLTIDNMSLSGHDCAQVEGNNNVNKGGSASKIGVDIDGRPPYNYPGSETDLNISTSKVALFPAPPGGHPYQINIGGSNITQEQCQALWDKSNPNSLTGFDYEENKVWYDALDGNIASRQFLNDTFGLTVAQLDLILNWINVSIHTWAKNVLQYTQNSWNSGFIVTRSVEEWLFTANDTAIWEHQKYYNNEEDLELIGFFDNCQNTAEAEAAEVPKLTIKTGRDDASEVGQVTEFNGQKEINIWAEPIKIEGTLGTQFAPGVSEEDDLKVFNVDLMRVVDLEYDEPAEIYDIELLQFELAEDTFSPDPLYFQNTEGIANLATVEKYHNAPVMVSKPHFLGTPLSVVKGVSGMSPNSDIHETYVRIEPLTGIVMQAGVKAQVNFQVRPDDLYYPNISNTIMPVVWFEEYGEIPEDLAEEFKDVLYSAIRLKENAPIVFLGIGAVLCVPGAALLTSQVVKRRKIKREGLVKAKYKKLLRKNGINKKDKILDSNDT